MAGTKPLSLLTILVASACGGGAGTDIDATLRFADLSDVEISRLVGAAMGDEGFRAQFQAHAYEDPFEPDPCPAVALTGDLVTVTGGCTAADGTGIEGSIEIENPTFWGDYESDFGKDSVYAFDQFAVDSPGFRLAYDGTVVVGGNFSKMEIDLVSEFLGVVVRSDVLLDYGRGSVSIKKSGVELVGAGGAHVSGKLTASLEGGVNGTVTLRGADTVIATIENSCLSWRLEGTDRSFSACAGQ